MGEVRGSAHGSNVTLARVIRVSDVKESLTIDYENVPLRLISLSNAKRFALRDEDIVVVKSSGSKAKIISGRAALFREQPELFIPLILFLQFVATVVILTRYSCGTG
jgi:hypothetical protein